MSVKVRVTIYPGAIKQLESAKKKAFDATVEAVLADIKLTSFLIPLMPVDSTGIRNLTSGRIKT